MAAQGNGQRKNPCEFWLASVQSRLAHIQDIHPLQADSVISALKTLDDELAAVHLAMCSLRARRNALLPISSLPPEVLARIFYFHSVAERPPYRRPPQIGWIRVTHVCGAWREIALQQPYLWSEITIGLGPKWLERMLARAKMVPVSISRTVDLKKHDFVSKHLPHIRRIRLSGTASQVTHALTPSADVLEQLEITQIYDFPPTPLPVDLCNGHAPRLHRVKISDALVPWSAMIFCNLTYLDVRLDPEIVLQLREGMAQDGSPFFQDGYTFQQLLGMLTKMPGLKRLFLHHCLPFGNSNLESHHVSLPQLETLSLSGTTAQCSIILRNLTIPPSCQVKLECDRHSSLHTADIIRFVAVHANAGDPFLVVSISANGRPGLYCLEAWRSYSPPILGPDFLSEHTFEAGPYISISLARADFEALCAGFPFDNIRRLSIDLPDYTPPQTWIELFGRCKFVEHLSVGEGPTAVTFVRALIGLGIASGSSMPTMDMSRTIRSLELHDVHDIDDETRTRICFATRTWLHEREQSGRVPRLYLKYCSIDYSEVGISE